MPWKEARMSVPGSPTAGSGSPSDSNTAYDWLMALASLWLSGGIMIDAWYHFHSTVETFFEPAHGLLYAGLLASYVFTGITMYRRWQHGYRGRELLPLRYEATALGLIVCLAGGVTDMIKHSLWGFEEGFNALLSPTHLLIGVGMFLIIAGPMRSALGRTKPPATFIAQLPLVLATASMLELVHWGTQFIFLSQAEALYAPLAPSSVAHATITLLTLQYDKQGLGLLAVMVQSILVASFFLYLARRIQLAQWSAVVLLVTGNAFVAAADSNYAGQFVAVIVSSAAAGFGADLFRLNPVDQLGRRWLLAAFAIPAIYWACMLAILAATMGGLWWSPDVLVGSVFFAGICGVLLNALTGPFVRSC
jgi:hypothetical protein